MAEPEERLGDGGPGRLYLLVFERGSSWMFELPCRGDVVIGRGADVELRLSDPSVSRRHAVARVHPDGVVVDNLGQDGTLVNGERILRGCRLRVGDTLRICDAMLVLYESALPGPAPAPVVSASDLARGGLAVFGTRKIGRRTVTIADPAMIRLYSLIDRLAAVDLPILICGETGSGKELAATAVHERSPRGDGPLVAVNCAAIPETLLESELFGYERGAFSGAVAAKAGLFEAASGGTLFLDEIGDLPLSVQGKLLRVLETRRVTRIGDIREREVDVRLVAATNRDLQDEVVRGRFRKDLYYRLSGGTLVVPPLRERMNELPLLAQALLSDARARAGTRPMSLAPEAIAELSRHAWPGNVRELKNVMEYLAAAHPETTLGAAHVAARLELRAAPANPWPRAHGEFQPIADELRELETRRMREALEATGWNQTRAAELIAMPVRTFFAKVKQYGLMKR